MVAMSKEFQTKYPMSAYAVRALRHTESIKPHVFKAFMDHSGLNEKQAHRAMLAGIDPPEVDVAHPGSIPGYSKHVTGDVILLSPRFVKQYEAFVVSGAVLYSGVGNVNASYMKAQRNAELLMESKLLHEMVHWGREMVSRLDDGPKKGPEEIGWLFEKQAYGDDVVSSKLGLGQYISNY
jgi:hypothetical protein